MIQVGITGGIGSGKTTVCKIFEQLGVPVYSADQRAKDIYLESQSVKEHVIQLMGEQAYHQDGSLNREYLSSQVFQNKELLTRLNQIIHPAVKEDYETWLTHQNAPYVLREAAILIESGAYKSCDKIIVVTAPESNRIDRVCKRDRTDKESVKARMKNQMSESERLQYADFEISNDGANSLIEQVLRIHKTLLNTVE